MLSPCNTKPFLGLESEHSQMVDIYNEGDIYLKIHTDPATFPPINIYICIYVWVIVAMYTAHKKFMNGFACRGFDPYFAIISTNRCQKTLVCKSAK